LPFASPSENATCDGLILREAADTLTLYLSLEFLTLERQSDVFVSEGSQAKESESAVPPCLTLQDGVRRSTASVERQHWLPFGHCSSPQ